MNLQEIKKILESSIIAISTVREDKPHAIAVLYAKVVEDKVIITDNYMKTTIDNILKNPNICLIFWKNENGWRVEGTAEYFNSGRWLEFVKSLVENKGEPAKGALVITPNKIIELG